MEPGDLRESPAGSGESDVGEWRECIEEVKAAECDGKTQEMALRDTCEEGESDKQESPGEQLHSPYEEELDPRIQVPQNSDFLFNLLLTVKHPSALLLY